MIKIKHYFNKHRLFLIIVVALLYGNTLKNGYSLDDSIVTEPSNITAKGIKAIPKIIHSYYIERAKDIKFEYRPLVKISFAIEHEMFGVSPVVSHAINLLLYVMSLFLLFSVLKLLLSAYDESIAFYCVLLFAAMPIHTEVVASLKNRDVLICFIFCMISFKHFLFFFESNFKRWLSLLFALLGFYLAFLTKLDALPFLGIIPVLAYVKTRLHFKQIVLFGALMFASYALYILTKRGALEKTAAKRMSAYFENPLFFNGPLKYRLIATFNCLGFYINQALFPFKQCCYYGYDSIPVFKLSWHGWLGILAAPALLYGLIRTFLKKDLLLFSGLFIFCAGVSMYLNLIRPAVGIVADRFAYNSSLGIAICIVALLHRYFKLSAVVPAKLKFAAAAVFIVFGASIVMRNGDWKSLDTLLRADYTKYPNSAFLNYREGLSIVQGVEQKRTKVQSVMQQRELFLKAKDLVEKSVAIDPDYVVSRSYLCYIYIYLLNDFKAAIPQVNAGLSREKNTELYFYKAICMRETKQGDSAEFYLKKCLELDKHYYNAYNLLSFDYNAKKEYQKTIDLYTNAIKDGANTLEINNSLGKTYWERGDTANAVIYYRHANDLDPLNEESAAMLKRLTKK
jgi:tetratricopeptide (TPR) repeat protein